MGRAGGGQRQDSDQGLLLRCEGCGRALAALVGGCFVLKAGGREVLLDRPPVAIQCESCRTVWRRPGPSDADRLAALETELRRRVALPARGTS